MPRPLALLVTLLALPLAQGGPGHEGPEAAPVTMHIHFAGEDRLPMQPMRPAAFLLPAAPEAAPACGSALAWTARFTQVPVDGDVTWVPALARDAQMGPSPAQLTWFVEMVRPGTGEPLAVPAPEMRLRAQLAGEGRLLADAKVQAQPAAAEVEGRSVHRFDVQLAWQNRTALAAEGLRLDLLLDTGGPCPTVPPGVRAYADEGHLPRLAFTVFEPVRIDLLEPRATDAGWQIAWHASSPWGRFDLQAPEAPIVRGPGGDAPAPVLATLGGTAALETTWDWQPGANGTYRVDATIRNTAGDEATARALFRIGAEAQPAPVQEPATKPTPAPLLVLPLAVAALVRRVSR